MTEDEQFLHKLLEMTSHPLIASIKYYMVEANGKKVDEGREKREIEKVINESASVVTRERAFFCVEIRCLINTTKKSHNFTH